MLIDTHAHLYYDQFIPDFEQVIGRAKDKNLKAIINIGADLESSKKALRQAQGKLAGIDLYASIGVHPEEASSVFGHESIHPNIIGELEEIYQNNTGKIAAIGECGLDYYFDRESQFASPTTLSETQVKELQKQLFKDQIALAKKLGLPLIIHCRDARFNREAGRAWDDIFLSELQGATGVFHSFTATESEARKALDIGYHLGLSCIITYPKNERLRQIIKWAPLDRLLTETDCPFLPPQNQRGQRNEPANVAEVIKVIAQAKSMAEEEVAQTVWQNACTLFRLPTI